MVLGRVAVVVDIVSEEERIWGIWLYFSRTVVVTQGNKARLRKAGLASRVVKVCLAVW